jgi:hypothetical protein
MVLFFSLLFLLFSRGVLNIHASTTTYAMFAIDLTFFFFFFFFFLTGGVYVYNKLSFFFSFRMPYIHLLCEVFV